MSHSWDSTSIKYRVPAKAKAKVCEPNIWPFHPMIQKQILLSRFDAIGHCLWVALAPKIAEICIWFWCMSMIGLGPTWLRLSPDHTPSLTPARVSDYLSKDQSFTLVMFYNITRALRAHTPCAPCTVHITSAVSYTLAYAVDDLYLHVWGQSYAWAESTYISIVGMVDGCGYDGQLKYTISDVSRPCHSIVSILNQVFRQLR